MQSYHAVYLLVFIYNWLNLKTWYVYVTSVKHWNFLVNYYQASLSL